MTMQTTGIHHITAFVRNAQATADFYAGVLGLRLVKKTINFDAPEVYHLYFGDQTGSPATMITFFPWKESRKGVIGGGQVGLTTYVVPVGTLEFWQARLHTFNIPTARTVRFSETFLQFTDPDGLQLELVEREEGPSSQWSFGGVSADRAIKGFGGAVLYSVAPQHTASVLIHVLGLEKIGQEGDFMRFKATGDLGNVIELNATSMKHGIGGAGTVHHIAWRARDFAEHEAWRLHVEQSGYQPTPIVDRQYFHALYFREVGGILFEIATDPQGFARDEDADRLGEKLMLPEWYEEQRQVIEQHLSPLEVRVLEADQI